VIDFDRARLDCVLPVTAGAPDWEDVLRRAGAQQRRRRRLFVALAAAAFVFAVGTASAFGTVRDLIPAFSSNASRGTVWS
jgi:hypothetical protein